MRIRLRVLYHALSCFSLIECWRFNRAFGFGLVESARIQWGCCMRSAAEGACGLPSGWCFWRRRNAKIIE
jgi:hypothetical protein